MRLSPFARPAGRPALLPPATAAAAAAAAALLAACASTPPPGRGPNGVPTVASDTVINATRVAPARAELRDLDGRAVGTVTLTQTPRGVLLSAEISGLPAGVHAMHFHEVGRCESPFTSAGGHHNPLFRVHGFRNPTGNHAGDLPNFSTPATGTTRVDVLTRDVTLAAGIGTLFDGDGTALVIHAGADDYQTDPAGNAGGRIACGVVTRAAGAGPAGTPAGSAPPAGRP